MRGDSLALAAVGALALVGAASKRGSRSQFPGLTKLRDYLGEIHGLIYGGEEISYDLFPDPEDPDTLAGLVELIRNADYELTGKISKNLGAYESDARGVLEGSNEVVHLADGGWSRLTLSLHHPQLMWIDRGASTDRVVKAWDAFQEGLKRGSGARRARVVGNYRLHHIANLRGTYSSETWEGRRANEEGHKLWEDPMHGRVDTHDKWVLVEFPLSLLNYDDYDIEGQYALEQDVLYSGIDLDPGLAFYDEEEVEWIGDDRVELYWGGARAGAADYRDEETFQVFMPEEHWRRYRNRNSIRSLKGSKAKDACGDCFEASGRYFMDHAVLRGNDSSLRLVHGEVAGQGKLWGTRFGHAWVEDGDDVVDVSMGRDVRMPRILYYALGHIDKIDNLHKYDVPTFRKRIAEHEHWGPWDLKTSSGL